MVASSPAAKSPMVHVTVDSSSSMTAEPSDVLMLLRMMPGASAYWSTTTTSRAVIARPPAGAACFSVTMCATLLSLPSPATAVSGAPAITGSTVSTLATCRLGSAKTVVPSDAALSVLSESVASAVTTPASTTESAPPRALAPTAMGTVRESESPGSRSSELSKVQTAVKSDSSDGSTEKLEMKPASTNTDSASERATPNSGTVSDTFTESPSPERHDGPSLRRTRWYSNAGSVQPAPTGSIVSTIEMEGFVTRVTTAVAMALVSLFRLASLTLVSSAAHEKFPLTAHEPT
mmetsp:Transcript_10058/g.31872  ORF Transcript_10058/g.31872 Transcript_10058/m.31872 type:complete len:291 (-) Transcript_10058:1383-2255(-)